MKKPFLLLITALLAVAAPRANAQSWKLIGNAGTDVTTNFLGTTDAQSLAIRTNNKERMRITKGGNVGIGIKSPEALLNLPVGGNVTLTTTDNFLLGATTGSNLAFDNNEIQARSNGTGSTLYLNYWGGATWVGNRGVSSIPALYAADDGEVGIGSSTTQAGFALTINPFSTGGAIYINDPGIGNLGLGTKSGSTGEGFRMNISSTTNPNAAIRGHTDGNGYGVLAEATGPFGFGVEGYSSQSFGVWGGTGNSSSYAAYFSGDVFCSGSYFGSDQKLKQDIKDFTSAMGIINQLHPKQYQYRRDGSYKLMNLPRGEHFGLIAQDVEKVLPNLVKDSKFYPDKALPSSNSEESVNTETIEFKALNYTEIIPILIKGMQEQQQQIDELNRMVAKLQGNSGVLNPEMINGYLKQNTPNPFTQSTVISCYVPANVSRAQLIIYNVEGRQLESFNLNNTGLNDVTISAGSLPAGQYTYSLLVDGKMADSKNMVLTK